MIYVFGAFLVITGIRMARSSDEHVDPGKNPVLRAFRRFVPMTDGLRDERFFVKEAGRRLATPLLAVLVVVSHPPQRRADVPLLEIERINTFYGKSHILHDVSLTVYPGELVCLLGRNGAGKPTTLHSIIGLTPPLRGDIRFGGAAIARSQAEQISRLRKERRFRKGETVIMEGSGGAAFFFIDSGEAKVSSKGVDRATLGPGDHFGEIALIDGGPRSATVTAATDLVCYGLTFWEFRPLVEKNGTMGWKLLEALAKRLREADKAALPSASAGETKR